MKVILAFYRYLWFDDSMFCFVIFFLLFFNFLNFYCKANKSHYSVKNCIFLKFFGGIRGFLILTWDLEKKTQENQRSPHTRKRQKCRCSYLCAVALWTPSLWILQTYPFMALSLVILQEWDNQLVKLATSHKAQFSKNY